MVTLPSGTHMGLVRLRVRDLDREADFYRDVLGLREQERTASQATYAAADESPLIALVHAPDAPVRPPRTTGLYHFALLYPDRAALGAAVRDVAGADHPFHGFSDHLVSEAAYLADPENNGIELYRDRPESEWQWNDGSVRMATERLDVQALLADASSDTPVAGRSPRLRMGHVHLHVADRMRAAAFYTDVIGFDVTTRDYPGAMFLSANRYHHHVAVNEWAGETPPPPGATGLIDFEIVVPDDEAVEAIAARAGSGVDDGIARLTDPDGNGVVIRAR